MSEKEVNDAINSIIQEQTNYGELSTKPKLQLEGGVKEKKKSLGKKFSETFLSDDMDSVKGYLAQDVIIPAIKNLIFDTISNGLQMLLWSSTGDRGPSRRDDGGYRRDYTKYSKSGPKYDRPASRDSSRDRFDFRDLVFDSRRDAEEVLYELRDYVDEYGHATVADYYNAIPGIASVYTDRDWVWTDLRDARVKPVRDGYIITLPRPKFDPDRR